MSEIDVQNHSSDYYGLRYSGDSLRYHTAIIEEMMEGAHGRILDVGCGTGIISTLYPELDIMGVDISPGMLRHHPGKWKMASVEKLPFRSNYFDFVVCRSVLHHLPDLRAGLREIYRVLKPGGKFVCWETNKGTVAHLVRSVTQHGDRFSEYHAKEGVVGHVQEQFKGFNVKYGGFFAYLLAGFPDIVKFPWWVTSKWRALKRIDEAIPEAVMKRLGFYVMIKGEK